MDGTFNALGNSESGDRGHRARGPAVPHQPARRAPGRDRPLDPRASRKFSFCVAEDEEGSPWEPLATARGVPAGASAVTVMAAGAPRQVMNEWTTDPEEILETFAAEIRANMRQYSIWPGHYAVIVPRQLREHLAAAAFSRADVRAGGCTSGLESVAASGPMSARVGWCGTGATPSTGPCPTPSTCSWWRPGAPRVASGRSIPPWFGGKSRAVTLPVGACVDCGPPGAG